MIFSTWSFALYFTVVFTVYWLLPRRGQRHVFLLAASYFFYMCWNAKLVTIVIGLTLVDYCIGLALQSMRDGSRRKLLLVGSLVANLGMLAVFKYLDFFILSLRDLLTSCGMHVDMHVLNVILPVGISFHTFQTMSYTIDVYQRRIPAERSLVDFALFVAFFPQLVAGPIVRASDFLPQLAEKKTFSWGRLETGTVLFMIGLTKKVLIADHLATLGDPVFAHPEQFCTRDLWLAMFCYGGQIYCDFSGYTDMAIATAGVLGFDVPQNFASPYLARDLSDFWKRWHISLSSWLRDFLYIPLGGSRGGKWFTYRNLMITMLLGGLWHGASWTFVIWGAIHGAALIGTKMLTGIRPAASAWAGRLRSTAGWATTLLVVHLAWVFFRCQPVIPPGAAEPEPTTAALNRALYFVSHLFVPTTVEDPTWLPMKPLMILLLGLMAGMQVYEECVHRGRWRIRLPAALAGASYAAWILVLVIFSSENTNPFVYFQF